MESEAAEADVEERDAEDAVLGTDEAETAALAALSVRWGAEALHACNATMVAAGDFLYGIACPVLLNSKQARDHPRWPDLQAAARVRVVAGPHLRREKQHAHVESPATA